MNDTIIVVHGGTELQRQVFNGTLQSLKWFLLYFTGETKDLVRIKKLRVGDRDCTFVKEVLGRMVDAEASTIALKS